MIGERDRDPGIRKLQVRNLMMEGRGREGIIVVIIKVIGVWSREIQDSSFSVQEHVNSNGSKSVNHSDVLKALAKGLEKTEEAYLDIADQVLDENPELALMGSFWA